MKVVLKDRVALKEEKEKKILESKNKNLELELT